MANKGIAVGFETRDQMNEFLGELHENANYYPIEDVTTPNGGYVRLCGLYYDFEKDDFCLDYSDQALLMYGDCARIYSQKTGLGKREKRSQEA